MYFREIKYLENFNLDELKYCTAYYLSSLGRNEDATQLLNVNYDIRTDVMEALHISDEECTGFVGKKYFTKKYFKTKEEVRQYNEYIIQFTLESSAASILIGFLNTKLGEDFISSKLYNEFGKKVSRDKVLSILEIFKEETIKSYASGYKDEGHPAAYLSNAFGYFIKGKKIQLAKIINQGSIAIGEDQKDLNQIKNESIQNIELDYDIPNFTELVRNIYDGSIAIKYKLVDYTLIDTKTNTECLTPVGKVRKKSNPLGIIAYDIFSCVKYLTLRDRIDTMLKDKKYSYITSNISRLRFKPHDINKDGYYISENDYSYRNYTSRRSVVELIIKNLNISDSHELYRIFYNNDIEGSVDKNNTKILSRERASFTEDINTFRLIVKGVKSTLALMGALVNNGIDPLSIPSEIFRDPAWLHRSKTLKEYLELYDNVVSLETTNMKVYTNGDLYEEDHIGLRFNKTLNRFIMSELKEDIASITSSDVKQALSAKSFNSNQGSLRDLIPSLNQSPICEGRTQSFDIFFKYKYRLERRYNQYILRYEDMRRFIFALEYFTDGFDKPYISRIHYPKPVQTVQSYYIAMSARRESLAILEALDKGKTFVYPVTSQDKQRIKEHKYPERIFDWSKLTFRGFFKNMSNYKGYTPRTEEELEEFKTLMRTVAINTLAIYDKNIRIGLINLMNKLKNSFTSHEKVELNAELLQHIGVTQEIIKDKQFNSIEDLYKYVYNQLVQYLSIVKDYPVYDEKANIYTYDGKTSIDKEIVTTPIIEWFSCPKDFTQVWRKIVSRARETGNQDLYNVATRVIGYLHNNESSPKPDYFELLTTQMREFSVILFIKEKLDNIFYRLADYYLNDIEFIDIIKISKDFINMLADGIKYDELVKFDSNSFGSKFAIINRPCKYEDIISNVPLGRWLDNNQTKRVTRSIMTCLPKRAGLDFSSKMQVACNKAYILFKEEISFLKLCVDLVEHDDIAIDEFKKLQTQGKHDILLRYAAYIRAYPDKISKFTRVDSQRYLNSGTYTLYENEYIMTQGTLITKSFNNRIYYLHKSGVYVTPDLNINQNDWIIPSH